MPYYSWSYSGDPTLLNGNQVVCVFDSGVQTNVSSASFTYDAVSDTDGGSSFGVYAHYYLASDTPPITGTGVFTLPVNPDPAASCFETPAYGADGHWPSGGDFQCHDSGVHQRVQVLVYPRGGGGGSFPRDIHLVLSGAWGGDLGTGYCAYGTETQPGAGLVVTITIALVDAAIAALGGGVLMAGAFDTIIGLPILVSTFCDNPPPVPELLTAADYLPGTSIYGPSAVPKVLSMIRASIWGIYCRCTPAPGGSPPAVPYPTPALPPGDPGGLVAPVAPLVCNNDDICSALNQITRQMSAISLQLAGARLDIQLIQRQKVPFAYLHGSSHSGLSGNGSFAVSAILGLSVSFTTVPIWLGSDMDPTASSSYFFGWLNLGTADGWQRKVKLTHNPHLVLDVEGDITVVEYDFETSVVATVLELVREP